MLNQLKAICESPNESDSTGLGIRQNALANRVYETYDTIVTARAGFDDGYREVDAAVARAWGIEMDRSKIALHKAGSASLDSTLELNFGGKLRRFRAAVGTWPHNGPRRLNQANMLSMLGRLSRSASKPLLANQIRLRRDCS
jgi:hypothetical protein